MRQINLKKSILFIGGLMLAVAAIVATFGIGVFGVSGVSIATTTPVISDPLTADAVASAQSKANLDSIYQTIIKAYPSNSPMDTLIRSANKSMPVTSWTVGDYKLTSRPFADTVKTAHTTSGGIKTGDIYVTNISMWTPDFTALIDTGTGDTHNYIAYIVESVNRTTETIHIRAIDPGTGVIADVPSIAAGRAIVRLAPATSVTAAQTTPYVLIPDRQTNFCQRYMIQFELATLDRLQKAEVPGIYDMSAIEQDRVFDYKVCLDASYLFGQKGHTTNTSGDQIYTMGGFIQTLNGARDFEYGVSGEEANNRTFTDDDMKRLAKYVFAGNNGTDTRFLFGGSQLITYIMRSQSFMKQMDAKNTKMVAGIQFSEYVSPFGILMIKYHPLFDIVGMGYSEKGIVMDLNNVIRAEYEKMTSVDLKLRESGTRNVDAKVIEEVHSLLTVHEETHAVIGYTA